MFSIKTSNIKTKTYTKASGATREQNYNGMKFRRTETKDGSINEVFYISNSLWDKLELDSDDRSLVQYKDEDAFDGMNVLLLCNNENGSMFRSTKRNAGDKTKSKFAKNSILAADLVDDGLVPAEGVGNTYLAVDVQEIGTDTEEYEAGYFAVLVLSADTTIGEEEEEEEEVEA